MLSHSSNPQVYLISLDALQRIGWPRNIVNDMMIIHGFQRLDSTWVPGDDFTKTISSISASLLRKDQAELLMDIYKRKPGLGRNKQLSMAEYKRLCRLRLDAVQKLSTQAYRIYLGENEYRKKCAGLPLGGKAFRTSSGVMDDLFPSRIANILKKCGFSTVEEFRSQFFMWRIKDEDITEEEAELILMGYTILNEPTPGERLPETLERDMQPEPVDWWKKRMLQLLLKCSDPIHIPESFDEDLFLLLDPKEYQVLMDLYKEGLTTSECVKLRKFHISTIVGCRDSAVRKVIGASKLLCMGRSIYLKKIQKEDPSAAVAMYKEYTGSDSIGALPICDRTWNRLRDNGITTIEQLVNMSASDLEKISRFGPARANEIRKALDFYGLNLRSKT